MFTRIYIKDIGSLNMRLPFLILILIFAHILYSQIPRERVRIQNGTIVSDQGSLLRGVYISTDITNIIPGREDIAEIKNLGLNCIHLYAECPQFNIPGERKDMVDSIVSWTEKESVYVILTIGGCNENGKYDSAFVNDFWEFYAPRYKDKTHVIYEIVNEPYSWSAPYDSTTIAMEKWAYKAIRNVAPETHILLMSYAQAINEYDVLRDLEKLSNSVDWSNASLATHGYFTASENFRHFIDTIKNAGYAITVTEPESVGNQYVNLATTRVFEEEFVSYTHFIPLSNLISDPTVYATRIESHELRWHPDFGTWPESIPSVQNLNPFNKVLAGFYDEGYGVINIHGEYGIGNISNNDYVSYYNLDFDEEPLKLEVDCSSASDGGTIEIRLDSLEGEIVGECNIRSTGDWSNYESFTCSIKPFQGTHKVFLVFKGNSSDLMNIRSILFHGRVSHSQSYNQYDNCIVFFSGPAQNHLIVKSKMLSKMTLYNISGQVVIQKIIQQGDNDIILNHLKRGLYYIKVENDSYLYTEPLIIER